MPRVTIDNQTVEVPAGSTLLDAARQLGVEVPTLCWRDGCRPNTTCMVCMMKVKDSDRLVPSCATLVEDGLRVESETAEVHAVRRAALELLLSDHAGECRAPCQYACPFDSDVPRLIRQIAAGRVADAAVTLRQDVPLPAVLARVSADVCERACRRRAVDEPAAIGLLKQYVADNDLAASTPYVPPRAPATGRRVAIVGSGPAGLSAAYFLLRQGHDCTLFDALTEPGGSLRAITPAQLPQAVLDAEIKLIGQLGGRFELNTTIGSRRPLADLCREFDAALIAVGRLDADAGECLGLPVDTGRLRVEHATHRTEASGVFAAGDVRRPATVVQAAADGKAVAASIDQFLRSVEVTGPHKLTALRTGRPPREEIVALAADASPAARVVVSGAGLTDEQARTEAERCLHCDCHKLDTCRLRRYAEMYGADAARYRGSRRPVQRRLHTADIIYEPGKCILCGLCVQIAEKAREPLGLTFVGRGFDVRVAVPFDEPLAAALRETARACAEACPTGALALRTGEACESCQGCAGDCPPKQ